VAVAVEPSPVVAGHIVVEAFVDVASVAEGNRLVVVETLAVVVAQNVVVVPAVEAAAGFADNSLGHSGRSGCCCSKYGRLDNLHGRHDLHGLHDHLCTRREAVVIGLVVDNLQKSQVSRRLEDSSYIQQRLEKDD